MASPIESARWLARRARFVVRTEGAATALRRAVGLASGGGERPRPAAPLRAPVLTLDESASPGWPHALLLLATDPAGEAAGWAAAAEAAGIPAAVRSADDLEAARSAQQLADTLVVFGSHPDSTIAVLRGEAARLRQQVVVVAPPQGHRAERWQPHHVVRQQPTGLPADLGAAVQWRPAQPTDPTRFEQQFAALRRELWGGDG